MRIALLSDVHANLFALEAVLKKLSSPEMQLDEIWFLGDAVGFGPQPVETLRRLSQAVDPESWILGNHDAVIGGILPAEQQTGNAAAADRLNQLAIEQDEEAKSLIQKVFLASRVGACTRDIDHTHYILTHHNQENPLGVGDLYLYGWYTDVLMPDVFSNLQQSLNGCQKTIQVCGHSHVPLFAQQRTQLDGKSDLEVMFIDFGKEYPIEGKLAIINPGSVGQPRDGLNDAAFAILDTSGPSITYYRVPYSWRRTCAKLVDQGYPPILREMIQNAHYDPNAPQKWQQYFRKLQGKIV